MSTIVSIIVIICATIIISLILIIPTKDEKELEEIESKDENDPYMDAIKRNEDLQLIWLNNKRFFEDHEEEFKEKYPNKYIAVHNNEVIGTGDKIGPMVGKLYLKYGNIPLYADKPGEKETIIIR